MVGSLVPEGTSVEVRLATGVQTIVLPEVKLPRGMTPEDDKQIRTQSSEIAQKLVATLDVVEELAVLQSISALGSRAQVAAGDKFQLLNTRVRDYVSRRDGKAGLMDKAAGDITTLKLLLQGIDPTRFHDDKGVLLSVLEGLPFVKALRRYAEQFKTVAQQIASVEQSLIGHSKQLEVDSAELQVLLKELGIARAGVTRNAYLSYVLMADLYEQVRILGADSANDEKVQALGDGLYRASSRALALYTMTVAYGQVEIGVVGTIRGNDQMRTALGDMVTLGMNLVRAGFVLEMALSGQRKAIMAYQAVRGFIGEQLVRNAKNLNEQVDLIADAQKEPVVLYEQMQEAQTLCTEYAGKLENMRLQVVQQAADRVPQLAQMSDEIGGLKEGIRKEMLLSGVAALEAKGA